MPTSYRTEAAEPMGGPIVATKLHIPEVLAGRASRPGLVGALRDSGNVRLILVSAPRGCRQDHPTGQLAGRPGGATPVRMAITGQPGQRPGPLLELRAGRIADRGT